MDHSHRSKFSKNKKPFKGKSKGKIKNVNKGKVESAGVRDSIKTTKFGGKQDRYNTAQQLIKSKREALIAQKRLGTGASAPKIIGVVSITPLVDAQAFVNDLLSHENVERTNLPGTPDHIQTATVTLDKKINRVTVFACPRDPMAVVDLTSVADVILVLIGPDEAKSDLGVDDDGEYFTKLMKAQGLPAVVGVYRDLNQVAPKKQAGVKKLFTRYMHTVFEDQPKLLPLQEPKDCLQLYRWMFNIKLKSPSVRENRSYMLGESVHFTPNDDDQKKGTLAVGGYLRGAHNVSANQLIHVTGYNDFQVSKIEAMPADIVKKRKKSEKSDSSMADEKENEQGGRVLEEGTSPRSLDALIPVDPMAHEQSVITDEEIKLSQKKKKPSGGVLSDVQDVWDELAVSSEDEEEDMKEDKDEDNESLITTTGMDEEEMSEKKKLEREEIQFPDEVETPKDVLARERFARYRGLENFRSTEWDKNESLPLEYSQIYRFEDFKCTEKAVTGSEANQGPAKPSISARYVVYLKNVPADTAQKMCTQTRPVNLWSLFEYERKVSVLHFLVKRFPEYDNPVKAKEEITFNVGFRRFNARPLYSGHSLKSSKSMTQRFLTQGTFTVCSVFSHIIFPPAPVLMFLPKTSSLSAVSTDVQVQSTAVSSLTMSDLATLPGNEPEKTCVQSIAPSRATTRAWKSGASSRGPIKYTTPSAESEGKTLIASGSLMSVNPDRLLIKRIVLTGYPVGVNKRAAVVRHMFYEPDDIRWFKPVKLWTKYGLTGHIKEPRGTKGYLKATFDGFIKNHDTVCMNLYKRQFPPWDPAQFETH